MKTSARDILGAAAIIALLALALATGAGTFQRALRQWPVTHGQDAGSVWNERLADLRDDLPQQGVIGYISERDIPGMGYDEIDTNMEYAVTQYFLAPLIVQRGAEHKWVIANIVAEDFDPALAEELFGLTLVKDYGYGIYLLDGGGT